MKKYIALLRGINVGGRVIKMSDIVESLSELGLENIKSVLQTGNIVFQSNKSQVTLKTIIEKALSQTFDYRARVQILDFEGMIKIINNYPFTTKLTDYHDYVVFIENGLEKDIIKEKIKLDNNEQIKAGKSSIYWRVKKGRTLATDFAKLLNSKKYKDYVTTRNLNTLNKLIT